MTTEMYMSYLIIGFIYGIFIPFLARRFAKFMPATLPYAIYRIFSINKNVSREKRIKNHKYQTLQKKYFMRSLGWGITSAALVFLASQILLTTEAPWIAAFIMISLLLWEIDKRIELLPDILTVPLLILGFTYAAFAGKLLAETNQYATENSALGAMAGVLIPTIAVLFQYIIKRKPQNKAFGGGDIKLLAAVGSWFGIVNTPIIILLSCIIFQIYCYTNKKREGDFGPSIVLASLIMLFYLEY